MGRLGLGGLTLRCFGLDGFSDSRCNIRGFGIWGVGLGGLDWGALGLGQSGGQTGRFKTGRL